MIYVVMVMGIMTASSMAGMFYFKAELATAQAELTLQVSETEKAAAANRALSENIASLVTEANNYQASIEAMGKYEQELNQKLAAANNKLMARDMVKLRNSRHSELVLKVINRSISKGNTSWLKKGVQ